MSESKSKSKRGLRSPGYPAIDIEAAIDRARLLKEYAPNRKPIPVDTALAQWKYSPGSGAGLQQLASLKKFGLLEDRGSKDQRTVVVTDLAWKILTDPRPESVERKKSIREAALMPRLHAEMRDRWPHGLPADSAVQVWLVQEKMFNEKAVKNFLSQIRSTFEYAELDNTPETGDNSDDESDDNRIGIGSHVQWTSQGVAQFPSPQPVLGLSDDGQYAFVKGTKTGIPMSELTLKDQPAAPEGPSGRGTPPPNPFDENYTPPPPAKGTKQATLPTDSGLVKVEWPDRLTQEDFEDIKDWLEILERKIGRSAEPE